MTPEQILAYAKRIYETGQHRPHSPAWDQLGDVTRGVWLERAERELGEWA
jgi:hypothetical protein